MREETDIFTETIDCDFVLVVGVMPSNYEGLIPALKGCKNIVCLSVIEDKEMIGLASLQSRYEAGSEEGVLAILAKELLKNKNLDEDAQNFFTNLDDGYISAESNIAEEELEEINEIYRNSKKPILILGYDLLNHPRKDNITNIIKLLVKYGNFKVFPSKQNKIIEKNAQDIQLQDVGEIDSFDGTVVYTYPVNSRDEQELLIGSPQFMVAARVKDNDNVFVITQNGEEERKFILDRELKGTVALLPSVLGDESYYYKIAKIIKREN